MAKISGKSFVESEMEWSALLLLHVYYVVTCVQNHCGSSLVSRFYNYLDPYYYLAFPRLLSRVCLDCCEANKEIANFLDVTFDPTNRRFKPFRKTNNKLLYVHRQSNHPQPYWKTFWKHNQEVIKHFFHPTGFQWIYSPLSKSTRRKRVRLKIHLWPIEQPHEHTSWTKVFKETIFTRSSTDTGSFKISYSCTQNMNSIIASHNTRHPSESTRKATRLNYQSIFEPSKTQRNPSTWNGESNPKCQSF